MEIFWSTVVGPVIAGVILSIVLWAWKLPRFLTSQQKANEDLIRIVNSLEKVVIELTNLVRLNTDRHEVHDRIISDIIEEPYDSDAIAKDGTKYPKFKKRRIFPRES